MSFPRWLRPLAARLSLARTRRMSHRRHSRLRVESLEDRSVPAVFTVTTTDESGPGSLRQAITDANAATGADTITFTIPDALKSSGGWWTIQLQAGLPTINDTVAIDGTAA